jgi:hypothetical protein
MLGSVVSAVDPGPAVDATDGWRDPILPRIEIE